MKTSGVSRVAESHSFRPYRSFGAIVCTKLNNIGGSPGDVGEVPVK